MKPQRSIVALVLAAAFAAAAPALAEVKKEERNQVSFAGALGKVFNFFGGKSAREGVVSTVAVSGDRNMTTTGENTAQIIDLREENLRPRRAPQDLQGDDVRTNPTRDARGRTKAREAAARSSVNPARRNRRRRKTRTKRNSKSTST